MFSNYILIGLGGGLGAIARVGMIRLLPEKIGEIPCAIACINIFGCFLIGMLAELLSVRDALRYFLISGFLGGFTTFSAFAAEFGLLFEKRTYISAIFYAVLSVVISLLAFFAGMRAVKGF